MKKLTTEDENQSRRDFVGAAAALAGAYLAGCAPEERAQPAPEDRPAKAGQALAAAGCPETASFQVATTGEGTRIEDWYTGATFTHPAAGVVADYYPALQNAMAAYRNAGDPRGFTLLFGPQDYYFSATPELIRGMHLVGQGSTAPSLASTRFRYAYGKDGLVTHLGDVASGSSELSTITGICFLGNGNTNSSGKCGVIARAPIRVSNCLFQSWGQHGIWLYSDGSTGGGGELLTNTDGSLVENTILASCGGNGLYAGGPSGSIGPNSRATLVNVLLQSNGSYAVNDNSAVGCTLLGCDAIGPGGGYAVSNATASPLFLNCSCQAVSLLTPRSLVIGGIVNVGTAASVGQAVTQETNGVTALTGRLVVENTTAPAVYASIGGATPRTVMEFGSHDGMQPYSLTYAAFKAGWWSLGWPQDPANPTGPAPAPALALSTNTAAEYADKTGGTKVWFPNGVVVGRRAVVRNSAYQQGAGAFLGAATAPPTSGTWSAGDTLYNASPALGEPAGWVCVQAGTPGTWAITSRIDSQEA